MPEINFDIKKFRIFVLLNLQFTMKTGKDIKLKGPDESERITNFPTLCVVNCLLSHPVPLLNTLYHAQQTEPNQVSP